MSNRRLQANAKIAPIRKPWSIEIEDGVPIPESRTGKHNSKYPFNDMTIGQSFTQPWETGSRMRAIASSYGKKRGWKFTSRKDGDKIRIWRIK